jgi:preprotein translocase subunit SecF
MYRIIQKKKIWFSFSSLLVVASLVAFFGWGLSLGIDFTGGSLLEVKFAEPKTVGQISEALSGVEIKGLTIQPTDQNGVILRFQDTEEDKHQEVLKKLRALAGDQVVEAPSVQAEDATGAQVRVVTDADKAVAQSSLEELRYESVGPAIGKELKRNAIYSIILIVIGIIIYVAWAFRKVSRPVASWKYGVAGVISLFHDVIIVTGFFSWLGHFYNIEVNTPFVAALLTVFGYSIADTIVVFDRIRENLPKSHESFEDTINTSVNQTMVRSVATSFTVLLTLLAIIIWGGDSIRYFALALFIGIFFGTYSSIFLASPLLTLFEKGRK